jgi:EAL domain-containing protein (putative c-di-GMP-specific phosphodiesterase class I)/GGDEF domain-containing protein
MFATRSLRWALLGPVVIVILVFALLVSFWLYQRTELQARTDGVEAAHAQVDRVYALLRGRFENQLLSSQGQENRYQSLMPVAQDESILLLKNVMSDWRGTLVIQDEIYGWAWVWDGQTWQYSSTYQRKVFDEWDALKIFYPWHWQIQARPDVEAIKIQVANTQLLLFLIMVGLWLTTVLLVWYRTSRLVLKQIDKVIHFLAHLKPSQRDCIQLSGSIDMNLLATQLNALSDRLFDQHEQLQSGLCKLEDDRAYVRAILDAQPTMTILTSGTLILDANDAFFRFFNAYPTLAEFQQVHRCICELFVDYQDPLGYVYFRPNHPNWVELALEQNCRVMIEKDGKGHHFLVQTKSFVYHDKSYFVAVFENISSHVSSELNMQHQMVTDMTTQLPNRVKLLKDMQTYSPQGILLVKVLEFGRLNEVYGIQFGDAYLLSFADRLRSECGQIAGLIGPYRLSGSEFAYQLFDDVADAKVWQLRAQWLLRDLNERDLSVWGTEIPVMVSGGFSLWDEEVEDEEQLLLQAAMAISRARKKHQLVLEYDKEWRERQKYQQAQEWLEKVRDALTEDRIEPFFQPIYNQNIGAIDKYECLVRLRDTQGQFIAPGLFLDAVRHTREYLLLTQVMFLKSCALFAERQEFFSLNLSEDDFRHADHLQILHGIIKKYSVGSRLTLEVLESEEITSYEQMQTALLPFRALGCSVAIDDFGSGYANFAHITGLQAQVLKIDGSLIQAMAKDPNEANVVLGLVDFAHRMDLLVVAEFVSSVALWEQLASMGVDGIQGYAVSPPVRADAIGSVVV